MTGNASRPSLPALTGIRFLAALLVVTYHLRTTLDGHLPTGILSIIASGQVGVTLFFVLSGFILTYTHRSPVAGLNTTKPMFWGARIARIVPVYLLGLAIAAPFFLLPFLRHTAGRADLATLVLAPTFLQAWLPQTACGWNCPGWSVSAEAFFYALFPMLLALPWSRATRRLATLVRWACFLLGLALFPSFLVVLFLSQPFPESSVAVDLTYYTPLVRLPEFLLGMLLGQAFLDRRWGEGQAASLATGGLLGVLVVMALPAPFTLNAIRNALTLPFIAILIVGLAHGRGLLARFLSLPVMLALGEASYSLYILHAPVHQWLKNAWEHGVPGTALGPLYFLFIMAVLIPAALFTYRWLERPAQRALRRSMCFGSAEGRVKPGSSPVEK